MGRAYDGEGVGARESASGLYRRCGDRVDDVLYGASAREVVARLREALEDGEARGAAEPLRDLVADVARL